MTNFLGAPSAPTPDEIRRLKAVARGDEPGDVAFKNSWQVAEGEVIRTGKLQVSIGAGSHLVSVDILKFRIHKRSS